MFWEYFLVACFSFVASILTFFSGFGLGTILSATFLLFFSVEVAVPLTAVVHFLNNILKFFLLKANISMRLILRFGIPCIIGALVGANLLFLMNEFKPIYMYQLFDKKFSVRTLELSISLLLLLMILLRTTGRTKEKSFKKMLIPGGLLTGFIGGLSGYQGAFRSFFLLSLNLKKEVFIATGVTIACIVDITRITVYSKYVGKELMIDHHEIMLVAILSALAGTLVGNQFLRRVTNKFVQIVVVIFIAIIALGLACGVL